MRPSTVLDQVKREFGSREETIERAFMTCPSFRALCRDYVLCLRALARCSQSDLELSRHREAEYSELLQGLAAEVEARLFAVGAVIRPHPDPKNHGSREA